MTFFNHVASIYRDLTIKSKLIFTFILLFIFMSVLGLSGLYYISRIQENVTHFADRATPLLRMACDLVSKMQENNAQVFNLLRKTNIQEIQQEKSKLSTLDQELAAVFAQLNTLIVSKQIQLDIGPVQQAKDTYIQHEKSIITAHIMMLKRTEKFAESFQNYENLHKKIDKELLILTERIKTEINKKEERAKIIALSPDAKLQEMSKLLTEFFEQDYYLIDGIATIRNYLMQAMDITKEITHENNIEKLPTLEKRYTSTVKKFNARLKRIKSRIHSDEDKTSYAVVLETLEKLQALATNEDGLFQQHHELLKVQTDLRDQQNAFDHTTDAFKQTLVVIFEKTKHINDEAQQKAKEAAHRATINTWALLCTVTFLCIFFAIFIIRSITAPIKRAILFANKMSEGDFTQKIETKNQDEIAMLVKTMDEMAASLKAMIQDIYEGAHNLNTSSNTLSSAAERISINSGNVAGKAQTASNAVDDMNMTMQNIAKRTEQFTGNIKMIAAASDEMTESVREIAMNTARGSDITSNAVDRTTDITRKMNELGNSAQEISKFTKIISQISEQTNILALNATIEANRAGESGKGFAVVAGEIKALAQQTESATKEIDQKIGKVQTTTQESVGSIQSIIEIVNEINKIVAMISGSIEEQSATTQEISKNVNEAAQGIQEINKDIRQTSTVTTQLAEDISDVNSMVHATNDDSREVHTNSKELLGLSENYYKIIGKFKI